MLKIVVKSTSQYGHLRNLIDLFEQEYRFIYQRHYILDTEASYAAPNRLAQVSLGTRNCHNHDNDRKYYIIFSKMEC